MIYLSQSSSLGDPTVVVPLAGLSQENSLVSGTSSYPFIRLRPFCPAGTPLPQATITGYLEDGIGNPMAAGTSVSPADASSNISTGAFRPASVLAIGARGPIAALDLPNQPKPAPWSPTSTNVIATPHSLTVRGVEDKCSGEGSFGVSVTSPRGGAANARGLLQGEPRTSGSSVVDVRYRDFVGATANALGSLQAQVRGLYWIGPAGGPAATAVTIDWGDGTAPQSVALTGGAAPAVNHTYPAVGIYSITYTVTAGGTTQSTTVNVTVR